MSASSSHPSTDARRVATVLPISRECELSAVIYGSRRAKGPTPLVLHFHGGAFVSGGVAAASAVAEALVQAGAVVVSVDYPLAPDHPFPQALEAGHAALIWLHRNRRRLGGDGAVILTAGEEAGGNIAAAVALMARDRQRPPLAGQILFSPMLDPCLGTASLRNADIDMHECPWVKGWLSYLPRTADVCHPYAAPGLSSRLAQLPPTLLITARDDPLRDETLAFAGKLRQAGVVMEQLVVDAATGWPQSFAEPAGNASWAAAVQAHLQQFITARQGDATAQKSHLPLV